MLEKPSYIHNVTFAVDPKVDPNVEGNYNRENRPKIIESLKEKFDKGILETGMLHSQIEGSL